MSRVHAEFADADRSELIEMVRRARSEQPGALDELLRTIRPDVRRLARQSLDRNNHPTRRSDASDVTQATLLDAAQGLSQFLGSTGPEFGAWLKHVIERNVIDEVRIHLAHKRTSAREDSLGDSDSESGSQEEWGIANQPTPSSGLMQREMNDRLHEVIRRLPDEAKQIIMLKEIEGRSMAEIAELLECSERTAYRRYSKAIEDLADLLPDDL